MADEKLEQADKLFGEVKKRLEEELPVGFVWFVAVMERRPDAETSIGTNIPKGTIPAVLEVLSNHFLNDEKDAIRRLHDA